MTVRATLLVPTHDHGPTLAPVLRSALSQTVREIEVFVVGDGAPESTGRLVQDAARADARVRYFDNPKGSRHGEIHRHAALAEARGDIVCYLADDDLYLPEHVATMLRLLETADFASALPVRVHADGSIGSWVVDLARPFYPRLLLSGINRVPLSCGAHTLAFYRRLPAGWRAAPPERPADLHMWQQILSQPGCRAVSGFHPTVLHFPASSRTHLSLAERVAELESWERRLAVPDGHERLAQEVAAHLARDRAWLDERLDEVRGSAASRLARRLRWPFSRTPAH